MQVEFLREEGDEVGTLCYSNSRNRPVSQLREMSYDVILPSLTVYPNKYKCVSAWGYTTPSNDMTYFFFLSRKEDPKSSRLGCFGELRDDLSRC